MARLILVEGIQIVLNLEEVDMVISHEERLFIYFKDEEKPKHFDFPMPGMASAALKVVETEIELSKTQKST